MNKSQLKYYIILGITFLALIAWELFKPKPTDWTMTLERKDKIPFGTFLLYESLQDIFPDNKIEENTLTFYQRNKKSDTVLKNYIIINREFEPDSLDRNIIFEMASRGNHFLISAYRFNTAFSDTLGFQTGMHFFSHNDTANISLANKNISGLKKFDLTRASSDAYFYKIDTAKTTVIAFLNDSNANVLEIPFGKGSFIICCEPVVFTNFFLLKDRNSRFPFALLSRMPVRDVVWDRYYKPEKQSQANLLQFIFADKALKTAYFLLIVSILAYMLFSAKRKQRIIPVYKKLANTSLDFIHTLGHLYQHTQNHKDIALKKFNYFRDTLKTAYHIEIESFDKVDFVSIADKTGAASDTIEKIFRDYRHFLMLDAITSEQLLDFNNTIETFYKQKQ